MHEEKCGLYFFLRHKPLTSTIVSITLRPNFLSDTTILHLYIQPIIEIFPPSVACNITGFFYLEEIETFHRTPKLSFRRRITFCLLNGILSVIRIGAYAQRRLTTLKLIP